MQAVVLLLGSTQVCANTTIKDIRHALKAATNANANANTTTQSVTGQSSIQNVLSQQINDSAIPPSSFSFSRLAFC